MRNEGAGTDTLVGRAIVFASSAHIRQTDKCGQPYILHPLRVMFAVRDRGCTEEVQAAAVLHDTVEDTDTTLETIRDLFGDTVARFVDRMTRRKDETYKEYIVRCCEIGGGRYIKEADVGDNSDLMKRYHPDAPYGRYIETVCYLRTGSFKPEKK